MRRLFFVDKGRCFRRAAAPKKTSIADTKNKINNIFSYKSQETCHIGPQMPANIPKYPWSKQELCLKLQWMPNMRP